MEGCQILDLSPSGMWYDHNTTTYNNQSNVEAINNHSNVAEAPADFFNHKNYNNGDDDDDDDAAGSVAPAA
ncbi:hypothetical protein Leryth_023577 [Lithospermum erythrorhizon]|nr:hypothetical protein Leryth_023577 [Lithospermum erythrorhizon]